MTTDQIADPETNPLASYALEPGLTNALTDRILATSGRTETTFSPITGQPLAVIPQSTDADVEQAFAKARAAQRTWARTSLDHRAAILLRFHDLVLERQSDLLDLICWETGKARRHAYEELAHLALTARYYARTIHQHLDTRRVAGALPVLTRSQVNRAPKGVVGIISPWNYPLTMAFCDGLPALMAGNAVVAKPDAQTMLTALAGAQLLDEAGFPRDLWTIVAGPGPEIGGAIIGRADYICFTGSTATGKKIAAQCADRLIGCSLELGGKNPILVLRDANLHRAAEGAIRASFSNAGQLCVSTERMYVADQIYDKYVDLLVNRINKLNLGAGTEWGIDVGTLNSQAQLDTVQAQVDDAVAKGATVLVGGKARPDIAPYYFEPTLLTGVTPAMTCFGKETFGPVVSIYRFRDETDAIARANDGDYGLNASIYSRDTRRARSLAREIKCGTVNINEGYSATFASIEAPMGGMRQSGLGRRQGAEGILRYTESQAVSVQRLLPIAPSLGMSDKAFAATLTLGLKALKKIGKK